MFCLCVLRGRYLRVPSRANGRPELSSDLFYLIWGYPVIEYPYLKKNGGVLVAIILAVYSAISKNVFARKYSHKECVP